MAEKQWADGRLVVELRARPELTAELAGKAIGRPYEGEYQVTPKISESVVLQTEGKSMQKDVTVLKIPQFEVSNPEGGKTLIIGDEYYG